MCHQHHFPLTRELIHLTMSGMKRCPNCSLEYDDNISFCTKDGRALVMANTGRARLCPHCANSIEEHAVKCPYCKAEFGSAEEKPQWPGRDEMAGQSARNRGKPGKWALTKPAIATLAASLIVVLGLGLFLIAGYRQRSDARQLDEANSKQAQEREERITTLEGELKQLRQELDKSKSHLTSLAAKLEENQKELSSTQQRLTAATREAARVAAKRPAVAPASSARSVKTSPSQTPPARRSAEPGVYEVIRSTTVREEPSTKGRRVTEIDKGTKITVVRTVGNWFEVRSKQGRPPGYVRSDDVILVTRTN
jgi:Skp family chaperone for outer membrane proteins